MKVKVRRKAVPGLCLFCNNSYPRGSTCYSLQKYIKRVPKNRRCFTFLSNLLEIKQPTPNGFNFISETLPLCSSCTLLFNQLDHLQLKAQAIQFQIQMQVDEIRSIILKSKSSATPPSPPQNGIHEGHERHEGQIQSEGHSISLPEEECESSHFDVFRRQVQPKAVGAERDIKNDLLPEIRLSRLTTEEIEKYTRKIVFRVDEEDFVKTEPMTSPPSLEYDYELGNPFMDVEEFNNNSFDEETNQGETLAIVNVNTILPDGSFIQVVELQTESVVDKDSDLNANQHTVLEFETNLEEQPPNENDSATQESHPTVSAKYIESTTENSSSEVPTQKRSRTKYPKAAGEDDCKICDKKCKNQNDLANHYKSDHPGHFPISCPECEYACFERSRMRRHFTRRHGPAEERDKKRIHACKLCPKKYNDTKALAYHMKTHRGEKPFQCSQCNKGFRQQQALDVHIFRIHENVRSFHCPHCEWKFKDKYSLRDHIAIHTGDKKYQCHICGTKRIQLFALKAHLEVHKKSGDWVEPPWAKEKYRRRVPYKRPPNKQAVILNSKEVHETE